MDERDGDGRPPRLARLMARLSPESRARVMAAGDRLVAKLIDEQVAKLTRYVAPTTPAAEPTNAEPGPKPRLPEPPDPR
jgi:hypothetical protein